MAQRELHGRQRACRSAGHRDTADTQVIEQFDQRIGLVPGGRFVRVVAPQVPEARRRDDADAMRPQPFGEREALVETAPVPWIISSGMPLPSTAYSS